jgi:mono/diheme cytochrome c family protein
MLRSTATILSLLMLTVTSAESEESSVRVGFAIATEVCASCHIASPKQTLVPLFPDAPKFEDIANRPATSQESLVAFLGSAHGYGPASPSPTPQIQALPLLTDREKSGFASYILSLRKER